MTPLVRIRWPRFLASLALVCAIAAIALIGFPSSGFADCSSPGGVHINEVRYFDGPTPDEGRLNPLVELYNKGVLSVALDNWTIRDQSGAVTATLPTVTLPAGAILDVSYSTGVDDLDFSDGAGTVFTNGDSVGTFDHTEGGVALYDDSNVIQDYVTWSLAGTPPAGSALTDAINAGLWTAGDFVPVSTEGSLFTIRLVPDGYDHDLGDDWHVYGWGESAYGSRVVGSNAIQIEAGDGTGYDPGSAIRLAWAPHDSALAYHLQVGLDSTLTSGFEIDVTTASTETTVTFPYGTHFWRVRVIDACGEGAQAAQWAFAVFPVPLEQNKYEGAGSFGQASRKLGVPRLLQHKDTNLLCIYYDGPFGAPANKRPGCREAAGFDGPWDAPHPNNHAEVDFFFFKVECEHCRNYCARASNQMLNAFYGGNLSQDRISYQFWAGSGQSPEYDLGHDKAVSTGAHNAVIAWNLMNSTITGPFAPTYALMKAEIVAGFPMYVGKPGHVMTVDGYLDRDTFAGPPAPGQPPGLPPFDMIFVNDPWPTSTIAGWSRFTNAGLNRFWRIRKAHADSTIRGRRQEATVTTDTDGDGVMDFDEGAPGYPADRPRGFHSRFNKADTDDDGIPDKAEIRSYTFHDTDHAGHENDLLTFPDVDGDALRAENDCDTDEDKDYDNGEDVNANGKGPEAGETCVYRSASKNLNLAVTNVILCGPDFQRPEISGGTLGGNKTFDVEVKLIACTPPAEGAALASDGTIHTNPGGTIDINNFICLDPGIYRLTIDAVKNGKFDPGCDPVLCDTIPPPPSAVSGLAGLEAIPLEDGIELRWEVRSRQDYQGYFVQRSEAGGIYTRQNAEMIPNAADAFPTTITWIDETAREGVDYRYRIEVVHGNGTPEVWEDQILTARVLGHAPAAFALRLRGHNPFRSGEGMPIEFGVPRPGGDVSIAVYDVNGRLVSTLVSGRVEPGTRVVSWNGEGSGSVGSGVYFVRMESGGFRSTERLVVLN